MNFLITASQYLINHYQEIIVATNAFIAGLITVCLLIPGDQPEKALKGVVNFIAKFSNK